MYFVFYTKLNLEMVKLCALFCLYVGYSFFFFYFHFIHFPFFISVVFIFILREIIIYPIMLLQKSKTYNIYFIIFLLNLWKKELQIHNLKYVFKASCKTLFFIYSVIINYMLQYINILLIELNFPGKIVTVDILYYGIKQVFS